VLSIHIGGVTQIIWNNKSQLLKEHNMNWIKNIYYRIVLEIRYRKKLKELRKRDPFIYK